MAAALSSRIALSAVPLPCVRRAVATSGSAGAEVVKRGAPVVVVSAKKDNKRKEERKAKNREKQRDERGETAAEAVKSPSGPSPFESAAAIMQSLTICGSYKDKTGEKLLEGKLMVQEAAEALWNAPFVCASHDAADVFNYGNKAALSLWGLSWEEFIGLPSTKSAQAEDGIQSERRELLDKAAATGIVRDYSGVRQTSAGRRFEMHGATVWTITDSEGAKTGQAVRFDAFTWLDADGDEDVDSVEQEMVVTVRGEIVRRPVASASAPESTEAPSLSAEISSSADVDAASAAVEEQAAEVRRLKQEEGLSNADKEVQIAVEELLQRKYTLAALKK